MLILPTHVALLPAHQRLAIAVIVQAFRDSADPQASPAVRAQAKRFLAGSTALAEWCEVANLDVAFVRDVVARYFRTLFRVVGAEDQGGVVAPRDERRDRRASVVTLSGRARTRGSGSWGASADRAASLWTGPQPGTNAS